MIDPGITFVLTAHGAHRKRPWLELARKAEDLGYDAIALPDHRGEQLAPIPGLAAAAGVTTTLRLMTLVLTNGLRPPAMLVEELLSLDVVSNGRLTWGMGAGWLPSDFAPLDVAFPAPRDRVDAFIDAIVDLKTRFSEAHVAEDKLSGVQQPYPPLLIGASMERMVRYAAFSADIVHLSPLPSSRQYGAYAPTISVADAFSMQVAWVHEAAKVRPFAPTIAVTALPAKVTDDRHQAARQIAGPTGLSADQVLESPHVLVGTVDEICADIVERHQRWGIAMWAIPENAVDEFAAVIAALR